MKPVRTPEDHAKLLEEIAALMGAAPGTLEADRLEVLAVLASEYERRTIPTEPDPVEVLGLAMRGRGLSQAALSDVLGSRARASEVLSRRRSLSAEMVERVSSAWSIPRRLLAGQPLSQTRRRGLGTASRVLLPAFLLLSAAAASPFALYGGSLPDLAPLVAEGAQARGAADLPPHVLQAFIAGEDRRYLSHDGYDPAAIARAIGQTAARGGEKPSGGATITQQLIKVTVLAGEPRSVRRKVREILLSRRLEAKLDKDQILQLYLRHVYMGGGTFGVDAAARRYFDRAARELTVGQAAYLAALVDAPDARRFDRAGNRPESLAARGKVLDRMARAGFLTPALARAAAQEKLWN
ncbi:MAG TPA: transglycosylase domain-containing protein [Allosphingosinicella sp.]|jgi:penicillin-binding protein 1A